MELQSDTMNVANLGKHRINVLKEAPVITAPVRLRVSMCLIVDSTVREWC